MSRHALLKFDPATSTDSAVRSPAALHKPHLCARQQRNIHSRHTAFDQTNPRTSHLPLHQQLTGNFSTPFLTASARHSPLRLRRPIKTDKTNPGNSPSTDSCNSNPINHITVLNRRISSVY